MKFLMLAVSLLALPALTAGADAAGLMANDCRPLDQNNRSACCSAPNWRELILPEAQASCSTSQDNVAPAPAAEDMTGSVTPAPGTVTPPESGGSVTPPDSGGTVTDGNPGNTSPVGNSGEKGMDNESPASGTQGNSN